MNFGVLLVLFVDMVFSVLDHQTLSCSYREAIGINKVFTFTNPNWPGTYRPGEICRWDFQCHDGYVCRLRCRDVGLPQSQGCYMDTLLVSPTGDILFRDARSYCGGHKINIRSVGTRISMALKASYISPGGRFRCSIKTDAKKMNWVK